jgi:transposase-like protein
MASGRRGHPDVEKEQFWRLVLEEHQKSGLSVREFCRAESISEPSFYAWRRTLAKSDQIDKPDPGRSDPTRLSSDSPTPESPVADSHPPTAPRPKPRVKQRRETFVPVTVTDPLNPSGAPCQPIEIVAPGGYTIRVSEACGSNLLKQVLTTLRGITTEKGGC